LRRDAHRMLRCVELRDRPDAGLAVDDAAPERLGIVADRRHGPDTGYDYAWKCHRRSLLPHFPFSLTGDPRRRFLSESVRKMLIVEALQLHPWDLTPREAAALQSQLASRVVRVGDPAESDVRFVAGCDCAFDKPNRRAVAA